MIRMTDATSAVNVVITPMIAPDSVAVVEAVAAEVAPGKVPMNTWYNIRV